MSINKELTGASAVPLLLSLLAEGENYGYALIERVRELSKGAITWTDGMLYPVLHRLEEQGLIEARWKVADTGRRRKYYAMMGSGRKALAEQRRQWENVHFTLARLWGT